MAANVMPIGDKRSPDTAVPWKRGRLSEAKAVGFQLLLPGRLLSAKRTINTREDKSRGM